MYVVYISLSKPFYILIDDHVFSFTGGGGRRSQSSETSTTHKTSGENETAVLMSDSSHTDKPNALLSDTL